jgi:hypothetical protein
LGLFFCGIMGWVGEGSFWYLARSYSWLGHQSMQGAKTQIVQLLLN